MVDGVKHIVKDGSERRNDDEKTYGMVPEDLEKFLAEHREIETTSVKEQPILSEKPTTDPTDSREDAAKQ
ncbi:MAG: hypothetical protein A4E57_01195 [Syntrophorhabdaceae bacterium PtaU1.Bin034]|nr:MAG: hypothetical protein A4E57_01195 [Syntrophorhabdaceae bacterium PtaU1.Bin034]